MQKNWSMKAKRKSSVNQERVEALMAEYGFYLTADKVEERDAPQPQPSPYTDPSLIWDMSQLERIRSGVTVVA